MHKIISVYLYNMTINKFLGTDTFGEGLHIVAETLSAKNLKPLKNVKTNSNNILISVDPESIEINKVGILEGNAGYLNSFGDDVLYYEDSQTNAIGTHGGFLYNLSDNVSLGYEQFAKPTVQNTTVETSIIDDTGARGTVGVVADASKVGSFSSMYVKGELDNGGASNDITFRIYVGGDLISTIPLNLPTLSGVGNSVEIRVQFRLDVIDQVNGVIDYDGLASFIKNNGAIVGMNISGVMSGLDTTFQSNQDIDITAQWSSANVNNILIVNRLRIYDRI